MRQLSKFVADLGLTNPRPNLIVADLAPMNEMRTPGSTVYDFTPMTSVNTSIRAENIKTRDSEMKTHQTYFAWANIRFFTP